MFQLSRVPYIRDSKRIKSLATTVFIVSAMLIDLVPSGRVFADTNALSGFYAVTGGQALTQTGIVSAIANVARDILGIITAVAALVGIIYISVGGLKMMGGSRKKEEGLDQIKFAFIGLAVALCAGVLTGIAALIAGDFTNGL